MEMLKGVVVLEWAFASVSATLLRQAHKERGTSAAQRTIPRLANIHDSTTLRVEGEGDGEGRAFPES